MQEYNCNDTTYSIICISDARREQKYKLKIREFLLGICSGVKGRIYCLFPFIYTLPRVANFPALESKKNIETNLLTGQRINSSANCGLSLQIVAEWWKLARLSNWPSNRPFSFALLQRQRPAEKPGEYFEFIKSSLLYQRNQFIKMGQFCM